MNKRRDVQILSPLEKCMDQGRLELFPSNKTRKLPNSCPAKRIDISEAPYHNVYFKIKSKLTNTKVKS